MGRLIVASEPALKHQCNVTMSKLQHGLQWIMLVTLA